MQQTISQAAKLYGKARSTIHRAIDAGRLSCSVRGDGVRVIQLAELIRLWGEPPNAPPQTQQNATPDSKGTQQAAQQGASEALLAELVAINRRQAEQLEALTAKVERLESAMLRLPAPDNPDTTTGRPERPQEPQQADTPADDTRSELRSLVAALRDSEG